MKIQDPIVNQIIFGSETSCQTISFNPSASTFALYNFGVFGPNRLLIVNPNGEGIAPSKIFLDECNNFGFDGLASSSNIFCNSIWSSMMSSSGFICNSNRGVFVGGGNHRITCSDNSVILGGIGNRICGEYIDPNNPLNITHNDNSIIGGANLNRIYNSGRSSILSSQATRIEDSRGSSIISTNLGSIQNSMGSVILGGLDLHINNEDNVVYVPKLKVDVVESGPNLDKVLVWDETGSKNIKWKSLQDSFSVNPNEIGFGASGSGFTSSEFFKINQSDNDVNLSFGKSHSASGGEFNVILGGYRNSLGVSSIWSSIIGGQCNFLNSNSSAIIGGWNNFSNSSWNSTILGGLCNRTNDGQNNSILNGYSNQICRFRSSAIIGGQGNVISKTVNTFQNQSACNSLITSGKNNLILNGAENSSIIGGFKNCIIGGTSVDGFFVFQFLQNPLSNVAIIGGYCNRILPGSSNSVILGGCNLTLASESNIAYLPKVKVNEVEQDDSLSKILVWDGEGSKNLKWRDVSSISSPSIPENQIVFGGNPGFASSQNMVFEPSSNSVLFGGQSHTLTTNSDDSGIISGKSNTIDNESCNSVIIGGESNRLSNSCNSSIIGGCNISYNDLKNKVVVPSLIIKQSSLDGGHIRFIPSDTAPEYVNGDMWFDGNELYFAKDGQKWIISMSNA